MLGTAHKEPTRSLFKYQIWAFAGTSAHHCLCVTGVLWG